MNPADAPPPGAPAEQVLIANRLDEASTDSASPAQTGLLARFLWAGDRYRHRIEVGGAPTVPMMQTVLRDPTLDWPDDPPLQQLSIETIAAQTVAQTAAQTVALGVGSAGTSHWSVSIETLPGPMPALRYDLACRCRRPPLQLASTFEMLAKGAQFVVDQDETVSLHGVASGTIRIVPEPSIGPSRWKETETGHCISIAADIGRSPSPGTFRWGFRVVWEPAE